MNIQTQKQMLALAVFLALACVAGMMQTDYAWDMWDALFILCFACIGAICVGRN